MTGCGFSSGLYKDILKAQGYITKRKYHKAVNVYEAILLKKPSLNIQMKVNDHLGEIYSVYLNDYKNSLRHYLTIINQANEPLWQVRALEKVGKIYFENLKDYKNSKDSYFKLINFLPILEKQSFYKFRYGLSIFHLKKYSASIKFFKKFTQEDKTEDSLLAYYYLGMAHFYKQEWSKANDYWFEYLKREKRKDRIVKTKFLIANSFESSEKLKEAYNIYYSILGEYPNPEVIKNRLNSLYKRRIARKR